MAPLLYFGGDLCGTQNKDEQHYKPRITLAS